MNEVQKLFICAGKDRKGIGGRVKAFLEEQKRLSKRHAEFHRAGGESGDLFEETAELVTYGIPFSGSVQFYTLKEDTCNGWAEFGSVIISSHLNTEEEKTLIQTIVDFLTGEGFVTNFTELEPAPRNEPRFRRYIDTFQQISDERLRQPPPRAKKDQQAA